MICDPMRFLRPMVRVNQELRDTNADDGRIAALEATAAQPPHAAYDLALRYFRGDGVECDSDRALFWMRAATEQGDFDAPKALSRLYLTGLEEIGRDRRGASTWLFLAAKRRDEESSRLLAEAASRAGDESKWLSCWRPAVYSL